MRCFDWIVEGALDRGCERLCILGDFCDSRVRVDIPTLAAMAASLESARVEGLRVIMIPGNHDCYFRDTSATALDPFDIDSRFVRVVHLPTVVDGIGFVPWSDDAARLARDCREMVGGVGILFSHIGLAGFTPDGLDPDDLSLGKFDRVLLGDVHEPSDLGESIAYVGAPMQHDFGDAGGVRGFVVLDTESGDCEFVENGESPRFHVVESERDVGGIRRGDFVRVRSRGGGSELVESCRAATGWVDADVVDAKVARPRLDTSGSDGDVMRRFVDYVGPDNPGAVLDFGLGIMRESGL